MKDVEEIERRENNPFDLTTLRHPFLEGLSKEFLSGLADCAMPVEFHEGEYIFKEGDPANRFYCLMDGGVDLVASEGLASEKVLQSLHGGDLLGWSWMCPPFTWKFDARATEKTHAVFFYATRLRERCEENPALGYELMKRISVVMMDRLDATRRVLLRCACTR